MNKVIVCTAEKVFFTAVNNTLAVVKGARARNSYNFISKFNPFSWLGGFNSTRYLELGSPELPEVIFHFSFRVMKI